MHAHCGDLRDMTEARHAIAARGRFQGLRFVNHGNHSQLYDGSSTVLPSLASDTCCIWVDVTLQLLPLQYMLTVARSEHSLAKQPLQQGGTSLTAWKACM
eukprot:TRINITY_DN409_c0_g1_i2.p1 TRINITY_DN409_c0_g1~~TRINITY_DN409_c0_g1_i2.p1  ORF type:complete len:100 (-),score=4.61 TRINITY_DN409_c0_g1_i2:594-893(-)